MILAIRSMILEQNSVASKLQPQIALLCAATVSQTVKAHELRNFTDEGPN